MLYLLLLRFNQVNISLIVNDGEAETCVKALHHAFFESRDPSELVILNDGSANGSASLSSVE